MKKGILMTLPTSDDVTEYLSIFSKEIISECSGKQIKIKTIEKENVTRKNVENGIKKLDYKMVIFNGHGSPKTIQGHKNKDLIIVDKNDNLLKDRITYARTCWTIMELGKKCMKRSKKGCFIGYRIPFMFIIDKTRAANPIKDKKAKIFFDTSNLVPIGIIKGHTTGESNENSRKSMLKAINKFLVNVLKGDKDSEAIAQALWNNYSSQEIVGNADERLF